MGLRLLLCLIDGVASLMSNDQIEHERTCFLSAFPTFARDLRKSSASLPFARFFLDHKFCEPDPGESKGTDTKSCSPKACL